MSAEHKMVKLFEEFRYRHDLFAVFKDFIELAALSISNAVDLYHYEKREKRYLEIVKQYGRKEIDLFPKLLGELTNALEQEPADILGRVYAELELTNKWRGQFFTPMSVAEIMAHINSTGVEGIIKEKGYVTVNEPAAGGGVTIIALAKVLQQKGYNYQKCMKVIAQDIDIKSVHMCYLHLSLLGIDAVVMRGDTLASKYDDDLWKTPAHILKWAQGSTDAAQPECKSEPKTIKEKDQEERYVQLMSL